MKKYKQGYFGCANHVADDETLSAYAKLVYFILNRYNPCYPSYEVIAAKCGISRQAVWRALVELEEYGAVKRFKSGRKNIYGLKVYDKNLEYLRKKTSSPQEPIEANQFPTGTSISSCEEPKPVPHRNSNNTNNKTKENNRGLGELYSALQARKEGRVE